MKVIKNVLLEIVMNTLHLTLSNNMKNMRCRKWN